MTNQFLVPAGKTAALITLGLMIFCSTTPAGTGQLGHFGPASVDVRDYTMPSAPGFYLKQYNYYYTLWPPPAADEAKLLVRSWHDAVQHRLGRTTAQGRLVDISNPKGSPE
jgi:hypothetical protein